MWASIVIALLIVGAFLVGCAFSFLLAVAVGAYLSKAEAKAKQAETPEPTDREKFDRIVRGMSERAAQAKANGVASR